MKSLLLSRLFPTAVLLLAMHVIVQAQPSSGGPGPGTPDPATIPIDGGVSLLLAGGVAYGLKRLRKRRTRG